MDLSPDRTQREQGQSAQAQAYAYLLAEIRSGRLEGGTHVVADRIASTLGISRMPVREAIRQLSSEGFMTIRSNRGAVVTALGTEEIGELYEMRAVLEGFAMRLVTTHIDRQGLDEADIALTRLDRARENVDWFITAHDQFHDAFLDYCPRPRLVAEIRRIRRATEPYLRMTLKVSSTAGQNTTDEHRELLSAIRSGNPSIAETAMREHVLRTDVEELVFRGA
ncbi:GntR family transcriptional regulator [Aestuariibius sp. 2305UL40-4]|uniref:GntR family transcriptional regulator n=1 Tax=Aestuariibius violaceus TaxID=3234132 RepID=UPI00345E4478